jgi:hypothetical protein
MNRERFAPLLLPLVIAFVWLVTVGHWIVKRGYRSLVDDGPARSWKYGLLERRTFAVPIWLIQRIIGHFHQICRDSQTV